MKDTVNTYLAMLIVAVTATFAGAIIVHVVNNNTFDIVFGTPVEYVVQLN
jgi:hypothetical protein